MSKLPVVVLLISISLYVSASEWSFQFRSSRHVLDDNQMCLRSQSASFIHWSLRFTKQSRFVYRVSFQICSLRDLLIIRQLSEGHQDLSQVQCVGKEGQNEDTNSSWKIISRTKNDKSVITTIWTLYLLYWICVRSNRHHFERSLWSHPLDSKALLLFCFPNHIHHYCAHLHLRLRHILKFRIEIIFVSRVMDLFSSDRLIHFLFFLLCFNWFVSCRVNFRCLVHIVVSRLLYPSVRSSWLLSRCICRRTSRAFSILPITQIPQISSTGSSSFYPPHPRRPSFTIRKECSCFTCDVIVSKAVSDNSTDPCPVNLRISSLKLSTLSAFFLLSWSSSLSYDFFSIFSFRLSILSLLLRHRILRATLQSSIPSSRSPWRTRLVVWSRETRASCPSRIEHRFVEVCS